MAYSAPQRPAAVYSAMAVLVALSAGGFATGLRLYMPHHHSAPVTMADIGPLTPAPQPPKPTAVAFAQDDPPAKAPPAHHTRAKPDTDDTATPTPAAIGDQANAAAITPADHPLANATDGLGAGDGASPPQPDETQRRDAPQPDTADDPVR